MVLFIGWHGSARVPSNYSIITFAMVLLSDLVLQIEYAIAVNNLSTRQQMVLILFVVMDGSKHLNRFLGYMEHYLHSSRSSLLL